MAGPETHEPLLARLTRREIRALLASGRTTACIVPVGAVEQHLEHLALEHDWRSVTHVARAVAAPRAPRVLVAEALMAGVSEHHMRHPGTLSLRPGTFLAVLADLLESLARAGFRQLLVLNGHGGNIAPCRGAWEQLQRLAGVPLVFLSYWDVLTADDARQLLRGGHVLPDDLPGHAQEFETALALAAFPENVRGEAVVDQADPRPALATREAGEELWRRIIDRVGRRLDDLLEGRDAPPLPPYFP